MIELITYLTAFSLIFAFIAGCISISNLIHWKKIELDTMKARIFLNKSFIDHNFKLTLVMVIISGGLVSMHSLMEYFDFIGLDFEGVDIFYYGLLPVTTGTLMLMAYLWHKVLNVKSKRK